MFNFRVARNDDVDIIFNLVNDPIIRQRSFNSEIIDYETHKKWFNLKLEDSFSRIYMVYYYETFAGYVRFETNEDEAIITIHLCEEFRGKSFGVKIIKKGIDMIPKILTISKIKAYIKPDNIGSIISFRDAGFEYSGKISWKNQPCILMEYICKNELWNGGK